MSQADTLERNRTYVSLSVAARLLGVSYTTARTMAHSGMLSGFTEERNQRNRTWVYLDSVQEQAVRSRRVVSDGPVPPVAATPDAADDRAVLRARVATLENAVAAERARREGIERAYASLMESTRAVFADREWTETVPDALTPGI